MKSPTKPVPPPVYRPQPTQQVLQRKSVPTQTAPPAKSGRGLIAPPVYRPQPVPKVLQRKTAATSSGARPPISQSKFSPSAPPVYRPETKKVLQPQRETVQRATAPAAVRVQSGAPRMRIAPVRKDGSVIMRQAHLQNRTTVTRPMPSSAARSGVLQRAAKKKPEEAAAAAVVVAPEAKAEKKSLTAAEAEAYEGVYLSNDKGASLPEPLYRELIEIIRQYNAHPDEDVKRGASAGKDITGKIGVGLCNLIDFIARHGKGMEVMLDHIYHPHVTKGANIGRRNATYKGKSFSQIVNMCKLGEQCNNELAEALLECLSTLTPDD